MTVAETTKCVAEKTEAGCLATVPPGPGILGKVRIPPARAGPSVKYSMADRNSSWSSRFRLPRVAVPPGLAFAARRAKAGWSGNIAFGPLVNP